MNLLAIILDFIVFVHASPLPSLHQVQINIHANARFLVQQQLDRPSLSIDAVHNIDPFSGIPMADYSPLAHNTPLNHNHPPQSPLSWRRIVRADILANLMKKHMSDSVAHDLLYTPEGAMHWIPDSAKEHTKQWLSSGFKTSLKLICDAINSAYSQISFAGLYARDQLAHIKPGNPTFNKATMRILCFLEAR